MTDPTSTDENKLIAERRAKLANLRKAGNAFPNDFRRTTMAGDLQAQFGAETKEALAELNHSFAVAGRLIRNRGAFLLIQDGSDTIQLYIDRKGLSKTRSRPLKAGIWAISLRPRVCFVRAGRAISTSTWSLRSCLQRR